MAVRLLCKDPRLRAVSTLSLTVRWVFSNVVDLDDLRADFSVARGHLISFTPEESGTKLNRLLIDSDPLIV
jgi:hypothetical protein